MSWYFRQVEPRYDFSWVALHHFFSGFGIALIGFIGIFYFWSLWVIIPLLILGLWILTDDIIQHIIQRREIEKSPTVICSLNHNFTKGDYVEIDDNKIKIVHTIGRDNIMLQGYYTTVTFWHYFPYLVLDWIKSKLRSGK